MIVFAQVAGIVINSLGGGWTAVIGCLVMAVGYGVHLIAPGCGGAGAGLIIVSGGVALAYSALPVIVSSRAPRESTATANGVNVTARTIGQAASAAVAGAILASASTAPGVIRSSELLHCAGFGAALVSAVVAAALGLRLRRGA